MCKHDCIYWVDRGMSHLLEELTGIDLCNPIDSALSPNDRHCTTRLALLWSGACMPCNLKR